MKYIIISTDRSHTIYIYIRFPTSIFDLHSLSTILARYFSIHKRFPFSAVHRVITCIRSGQEALKKGRRNGASKGVVNQALYNVRRPFRVALWFHERQIGFKSLIRFFLSLSLSFILTLSLSLSLSYTLGYTRH